MTTSYAGTFALFGFFTLLIVSSQLITGTMLSFSLVPESMMVPLVRDEEDAEGERRDNTFHTDLKTGLQHFQRCKG